MDQTIHRSKSNQVVEGLLNLILASGAEPGSSFATESELLEQFDVSRPTLREALRILEYQGVLDLRPGPGGGIIVRRPGVSTLAHSLSVFLRVNHVPIIEVLKAREVIEPALTAEAALNGTKADFAELQASIDRMKGIDGNQNAFVEENRIFHSTIARASGNRVLEAFWSTISILASGEQHGVSYSRGNQRHVVEAHERILAACKARNSEAAAAAMRDHVTELENLVRRRFRHLLDQPTNIVARPGRTIR